METMKSCILYDADKDVPRFGNMTNESVQWLKRLIFDEPAFGSIFHVGMTLQDRSAQGGPEAG